MSISIRYFIGKLFQSVILKFKSKAGCFYMPAFFLFGNPLFTSVQTEIKLSKFEKMIQA